MGNTVDMEQIRHDTADRLIAKIEGLNALGKVMDAIDGADFGPEDGAKAMDANSIVVSTGFKAVRSVAHLSYDQINAAAMGDIQQYAALLVRDHIAPQVRASDEPVCWLTSNNFMPPIRAIDRMDDIWNATSTHGNYWRDMADDIWVAVCETIELELERNYIYMTSPEWDNALYAVDLKRWEHVERDEDNDGDTLNDDWVPVAVRQMD
jgi:hypothetical protein